MPEKMKTVVFHGVEDLRVEEYEVPPVGYGQILVRVNACAICTWEQRVYKGINKVEYPFIGGHEIAGVVQEIGPGVDEKMWHVGDSVVCGVQLACNSCAQCKSGNQNACKNFDHSKHLPGLPYHGMGGLSSHYPVNVSSCFKYDGIPPTQAAIAEPVSCVVRSIETADIHFGDVVLVIGCGIMGQLNALLAAKRGAMVIVSDMNEQRTDLALSLGAKFAINPSKSNLHDRIFEITRGEMCDVVIDTTPLTSVVADAASCLANMGKLVFYSSFHPDTPVPFSPNTLHGHNLQFIGVANSSQGDFVRATRLLSEGVISVEPFVSESYPVEEAKAAFESACKGDKFRVVITF
ncbi:zinc-binding dehydrogenase [Olsenella sp. HMSC062G07]|uniref:zinc-dependent alcohol dehydrogenase n=1 Tax=Olsenella sp. HMSC062G07 TaxID=1739330 RepID=UPI0008A51778|nr:alcohol dehydrogenase catalytic domain-containing protein [Olsenella sp. HMSC062G07]OFK22427.1 alcohol dehydrogenase [Olsenella sp. HMSC062G07]